MIKKTLDHLQKEKRMEVIRTVCVVIVMAIQVVILLHGYGVI